MKLGERCKRKQSRSIRLRLKIPHSANHRLPILAALAPIPLQFFIELDLPWMLECRPHAKSGLTPKRADLPPRQMLMEPE